MHRHSAETPAQRRAWSVAIGGVVFAAACGVFIIISGILLAVAGP